MANNYFVVQNGIQVGPLTIDANTGSISTSGDVSITGNLGVSQISKNDSMVSINDTGTGSSIVMTIDNAAEATVDADGLKLASGDALYINGASVLNATTLGAGVVNSSLTSVGTLTNLTVTNTITGSVSGNAGTATKLATARTIALTGDVTGSATFDGSGNVSIATTSSADSIVLGTDTTGNYVATITGTTNQVTVTGSGTETAAVTLALPQNIHTGATPQFAGATLTGTLTGTAVNAATIGNTGALLTGTLQTAAQPNITSVGTLGNLTVTNTITGSVSGNAGTATKLATARTISLSGDVTGSVSFDGSGNADIAATIAADSVALGTDTTGNYVASLTNGAFITGANGGSESAALTLAVDATSTNTASKVVARDNSGNFAANVITANLTGTATQVSNALTINNSGTGAASGSTYTGSGAITISHNSIGAAPQAGNASIVTVGNIASGTWSATAVGVAYGGTGSTTAAGARTNLGLAIGTDVQAYNATLAAVAGGTYTGDDSIATVGNITTGTWNGSTISVARGGTGTTTSTGSGSVVLSTSPSLTTPAIGAATGTSLSLSGALTASGTATVNALTSNGAISGTTGTFSGAVSGASTANFSGAVTVASLAANTDIVVGGNLTVNGTTTTINASTLVVNDKNVTLANVATPTDVTADGGGITIKGATDKTFNWVSAASAWTSSEDINVLTGKGYEVNGVSVLNATTLGSSVVNSSLTSVGTLTNLTVTNTITGNVSGNAGTATKLATARTIALTGDVTGSGTFDGSGNLSIAATIAADSVALGTDTTGNYVATITNGSYITGANGGSEGAALTLAVDATSANTANKVVARDAAGSFAANVITATLSGNSTTATTLQTARNINGVSFNGSADITITAASPSALTLGTGLTGTSYNGSAAVTAAVSYGTTAGTACQGNDSRLSDTRNTTNAVTFNNAGTGAASGTTFNGSAAQTVSYNTIGASPLAGSTSLTTLGTISTGTWQGSSIATTYTAAKVTDVQAGTGVSVSATTGSVTVNIGQAVATTSSPTFAGITVPSITHSGTSGTGDIGASGATFGTVWAKATSAQYADLAEYYAADAEYEPGTVVCFGGDAEVTVCDVDHCRKVAGVVSTNPAYIMNSELQGTRAAVALQGRVPCKVVGPVQKGDMMVAAGNGRARAEADPKLGAVIGKALENFDGAEGVIEVVIGRV